VNREPDNLSSYDNSPYVCIIGVGACTPLGACAASSAAAVRAGIAAFAEHPYMIDTAGNPMIVARAPYISDSAKGSERFIQLATPAIIEALSPLRGLTKKIQQIVVIIGLPAKRPGLPETLNNQIAERFKALINEFELTSNLETISAGHSAGLMAFEAGWRKIQNGSADFCLIGGIDSYLDPETLEWLEVCDQLHSAGEFNNAWGFVPGEAAGFCLLASPKAMQRHNLTVLGRALTAATSLEKNLIKTETVCLGQGLTAAFKQVLQNLPSNDIKINNIICDMNGEPYRADEFGFTIARVSERFVDASDFIAPADCWGDVGAASGPLFINLATAAWKKGYSKGPYTLLWTSSEGGERSAVALQA